MTNEELDQIIEKIERECSESQAYFDAEHHPDFGFAKGNKTGLLLYAKEFLKAVREIDKRTFEEDEMEVYNPDFRWIKGVDVNPFQYIKITNKGPEEIDDKRGSLNQRWKDKLFLIGCLALLVFAVFLTIVGFATFLDWFF